MQYRHIVYATCWIVTAVTVVKTVTS
jgi:hypothetical protein